METADRPRRPDAGGRIDKVPVAGPVSFCGACGI